jgi:hypothetical protein
MAIIRSIHSILIDAPVSGLTIAELSAAYAHNRSILPASTAPPPLDQNPLGFNNLLELLICNCDYFVTQWEASSGEAFLGNSVVCGLIVPLGEYVVRPGAGASRSAFSEDANAPALSPYEMRTRKRIVHIMQVLQCEQSCSLCQ